MRTPISLASLFPLLYNEKTQLQFPFSQKGGIFLKHFRPCLTVLTALIVLLLGTVSASAADSGNRDLPKLDKYEIIELLQQLPDVAQPDNYYDAAPSLTAPHTTGKVRQELLDSGLARLNLVRRLAGLPAVTMTDEYNLTAQHGSVVLAAGNQFSHTPSQPEGMENAFYEKGYYATSHANLAYFGWSAPWVESDPIRASIDGYMADSDAGNLSAVGHRRWVLDPSMGAVGLGLAHNTGPCMIPGNSGTFSNIFSTMLWDTFSTGNANYDFVAWPASGWFPNTNFIIDEAGNNIYRRPRSDAWSVSLNPLLYKTPTANSITVTLTGPDGECWTFTGGGYQIADAGSFFTVNTQYIGEGPCIIFRPSGIEQYEGKYSVSITGLKTRSGQSTELEYSVEFFTPTCLDGHSYTTHIEEATCTTPGKTTGICSVCGAENVLEETPALDHLWSEGVCKDDSVHTVTCQRTDCGVSEDLPHMQSITTQGDLIVRTCAACNLNSARLNVDILPGWDLTASCQVHPNRVALQLTNNGTAAVEATMYLAEYDANGRFLGCSSAPLAVSAGASLSQELTLTSSDPYRAVVYVQDKSFAPLTRAARYSPAAVEYRAWYEVDENGQLSIRTNIDSSEWDGYTVKAKFLFKNGSQSNDFGSGYNTVNYGCSSMISYFSPGTKVTRTEFLVFRDRSTMEEYWALEEQLGSQEAVLEALADKLVARFDLASSISVTETDTPFSLTDFTITYNEEKQTETYIARLDIPLTKVGSYGLTYKRNSGSGASLSAINPVDGVLTFTREIHHFGNVGDSGTFYITYCVYTTAPDGSIICTKAISSGFEHTFLQ